MHKAQRKKIVYCNKTPDQHTAFLNSAAALEFDLPQTDIQAEFNHFYSVTLSILNQFYPEKTITVSSRDPNYITPVIKAKLRRKNKLMRAGRVEEASALAKIIGKDIVKKNSRKLNRIQGAADSKELWSAVRHITGRTRQVHNISGIDADTLNSHYANISTDHIMHLPARSLLPSQTTKIIYLNGPYSKHLTLSGANCHWVRSNPGLVSWTGSGSFL